MAVSRALRRLLCVLNIEEEQARLALESANADLAQLECALAASDLRARGGRRLVLASAQTNELPDRLSGLEEMNAAQRRADALMPRIADAESDVEILRQAFLMKRVECRQAETLIHEIEAREAVVATRRAQQGLDNWYLNRLHSKHPSTSNSSSTASEPSDLPSITDSNT